MVNDTIPSDEFPLESLTWREREILSLLAKHRTNREISATLNIEPTTVKWYNTQIFSKLGVRNRREAVAVAQALGLLDDTSEPVAPLPQNLPAPVTSFIGREAELAQLIELLGEPSVRLLTLTGPPGTGKTRLAREVASHLLDAFSDGVFFVALAPIRDSHLVASTIAGSLGIRETSEQPVIETLKHALRDRQLLLLLDNFEHVLEASPLASDLLAAAPELKVLVTSREVLHLYGEHVFPVPSLTLPDLERQEPPSALLRYEAVALFVDRARAADLGTQISGGNARAVAEICVRLDGLPLAIELAASRVRLLSPRALLERLENRLQTVKDGMLDLHPRHRTLRATIGWSYDLLDEDERRLFARLAVFHGGCTLEAATTVCSDDLTTDVLAGLDSLLNKNLLQRGDGSDGGPRFFMLETIHEYARERLEESGEAIEVRRNHAEYFVTLAETARPELQKASHEYWTERLAADHENMRAALTWSLGDGRDWSELGLRLASSLAEFWFFTGRGREGEKWLKRALEIAGNAAPEVRANALNGLSMQLGHWGDLEESKVCAREALRLYTEAGDRVGRAQSLMWLSHAMVGNPHEREEAVALCEEVLVVFREVDDKPYVALALNVLGEILRMDGNYEGAKEAYEECRALCREMGNKRREGMMLVNLGYVAQNQGDYGLAKAYCREAIILFGELGLKYFVILSIADHAGPALAERQPERAVRLLGASDALCEAMGVVQQPADQIEIDRYLANAREQLDEATFKLAWEEGQAMTTDEAVAYALNQDVQ